MLPLNITECKLTGGKGNQFKSIKMSLNQYEVCLYKKVSDYRDI